MFTLQQARNEIYQAISKKIGRPTDNRPLIDEIIQKMDSNLNNNITPFYIIKAPTGYGKTTITQILGLFSIKNNSFFDKVIHVLPMRTIIESAANNTDEIFSYVFGFKKISTKKMMGSSQTVFYVSPISFVTVDTFIYDTIKINTKKMDRIRKRYEYGHDYFTQASILNSLIIFDEVHMLLADERLKKAFATILKFLIINKVPVLIMSATINESVKNRFEKFYKRTTDEKGFWFFEPLENDDYIKQEEKKKYTITFHNNAISISKLIDPTKRNLIVRNTVASAVDTYKEICNDPKFKDVDKLLIHSKYTLQDKKKKILQLDKISHKKNFIIVATQVIEAGVDISSDILITDLAPPNSLIQRMGRVARRPHELTGIIHILDYTKNYPYDIATIQQARDVLNVNKDIHPRIPAKYAKLIDSIKISPIKHEAKLFVEVLIPSERSIDVLTFIENNFPRGFLRDYMIDAKISSKDGDIISLSTWQLIKLLKNNQVKVFINNKDIISSFKNKSDYYIIRIIRDNSDVDIIIDDSAYDGIYGLS